MPALRYADQERRNIKAAEERARQQSALNASIAVRKALTDVQTDYQPLDDALTAIAGLSPTDGDFIQCKSGKWSSRSPSDAKVDLDLVASDVGLGSVDNTSDEAKPISTAQQSALDGKMDTWADVPSSASGAGNIGQIAYDSEYLYVCVATDTWVRATLATW